MDGSSHHRELRRCAPRRQRAPCRATPDGPRDVPRSQACSQDELCGGSGLETRREAKPRRQATCPSRGVNTCRRGRARMEPPLAALLPAPPRSPPAPTPRHREPPRRRASAGCRTAAAGPGWWWAPGSRRGGAAGGDGCTHGRSRPCQCRVVASCHAEASKRLDATLRPGYALLIGLRVAGHARDAAPSARRGVGYDEDGTR